MKRFVVYCLILLAAVLLMAYALDIGYTAVYKTSPPRNKIQMLRQFAGKQMPYVFIGSSRVDNGIVPAVIDSITGKKALNLGFQAAKMQDLFTLVQLVDEYGLRTDTLFVQIDYNFNIDGRSVELPHAIAPFVQDNTAAFRYFDSIPGGKGMQYVPFYRYAAFDHKIGLREVALNAAGKTGASIAQSGYSPLFGHDVDTGYALPADIHKRNVTLERLRDYAARRQLHVVFFCAPLGPGTQNRDYVAKLKTKVPGLLDFSSTLPDSLYFKNNGHLNDRGARRFSAIFAHSVMGKRAR